MSQTFYGPARRRHCDVLRAIEDGCTKVRHIKARHKDYTERSIRTSITFLRRREMIITETVATTGNGAGYKLVVDLNKALEEIYPHSGAMEFGELEKAMGMPAPVVAMLEGARKPRRVGNMGYWDTVKGAG